MATRSLWRPGPIAPVNNNEIAMKSPLIATCLLSFSGIQLIEVESGTQGVLWKPA